jgi:hypothetical protein
MIFSSIKNGTSGNTISKSNVQNVKYIKIIPIVKAISATRLTINAFIAAKFALTLVYQKFIKRYEHKPTPSHPKNKTKKLFALTKTIIKNVKKDIYVVNFL